MPTAITPNRILAVEKQRRAMNLRRAGMTWADIAEEVGYSSAAGACRAVRSAIHHTIQETGDEFKTLQLERLNHMLLVLWPKVNAGDERAISVAIGVMDKMDRIKGTEHPSQIEHHHQHDGAVLVIEGNTDDYIAGMEAMARQVGLEALPAGPPVPEGPEAPETQQTEDEDPIVEAEVVPCGAYVRAWDDPEAKGPCRRCDFDKDGHGR